MPQTLWKKGCVFIDGENLRHALISLFEGEFQAEDYLPKQADWGRLFDRLVDLAGASERVRAYWYVIEHLDFFPYKFPYPDSEREKLRRLLSKHAPFRDQLDRLDAGQVVPRMKTMVQELKEEENKMRRRFSGWVQVQNGIVARHDAVEFRRAGAIRYNLFERELGAEKAVDVKLAVDLVVLRDIYDVAIIVSGDQDYVPAAQVVKDFGKRVINVSFRTRGGEPLPGGAWRLNQVTDRTLEFAYDDLRQFMNFAGGAVSTNP